MTPLRKYTYIVEVDGVKSFQAKSVNKPTLETDVNEYRKINQIVKFPTVPRWNDITIKFVDIEESNLTKTLLSKMLPGNVPSSTYNANAIKKTDVNLKITQYKAEGKPESTWNFKNAFIKSVNFGDNDYSADEIVEVEITIAYDWAYIS